MAVLNSPPPPPLPGAADVHREEGVRQGDLGGVGVVHKLVGEEDVVVNTVSQEHSEAHHKQQLTVSV